MQLTRLINCSHGGKYKDNCLLWFCSV